jgi:phosphoenolpyruvate synthase/pyruvate phosphate dikinase
LSTYKAEIEYLSRVPGWADRWLRFHFSENVEYLATIEPLTRRYIHDRLHGSPLLFYTAVLDSLVEDSNRLLGLRHEFFGEAAAGGLRGLNPGLARGVLRFPPPGGKTGEFDHKSIYVLPATTDELPPIAGIVTAEEGNALSHVQLLARNLGIPNVVVEKRLLPKLGPWADKGVVLAVSPRGVVRLAEDSPRWDAVFGAEKKTPKKLIRPDLQKLNLKARDFIPLSELRVSDSGRIAGPKAANLGELTSRFPEAVPDGLVIPFGVFRAILDQPMEPGGPSMFAWMQKQYRILETMKDAPETHWKTTRRFLARVRNWVLQVDPGPDFRGRLRFEMARVFGVEGTYGVFVRSDTNVEDLPGFTGAGLNLTVPNVVGFEHVLEAIIRVWASPFEERAYAWRQAHMEDPEHLYVSILLMKGVPAEKSGVMVTVDLKTGRSGWLSVAVNEGVGGAVGGQEAEELRVHMKTGRVRLMAQATEPFKRVLLPPEGGVARVPASGAESVLEGEEIVRLIELARALPDRFPSLRDAAGRPVPADIEFGFYKNDLVLFQIRPFLESSSARQSLFLNDLDRALGDVPASTVDLDHSPLGALP